MNDGKDLSEEYLLDLYTRITCEEMKMLKVSRDTDTERTQRDTEKATEEIELSVFRTIRPSSCVSRRAGCR